jgi:hypothetical protein
LWKAAAGRSDLMFGRSDVAGLKDKMFEIPLNVKEIV